MSFISLNYRHQNGISWGFYPNLAWNFDENAWKTRNFADIFAIFPAIFLSNWQKNVRYFFAIAIWKKIHAIHFFISCITSHQHCSIRETHCQGFLLCWDWFDGIAGFLVCWPVLVTSNPSKKNQQRYEILET